MVSIYEDNLVKCSLTETWMNPVQQTLYENHVVAYTWSYLEMYALW